MEARKTEMDAALFPDKIKAYVLGAETMDFSRSPRAKTYFIDRDEGYFLKIAPRDALAHEAAMMTYFFNKNMTARVCDYISDGDTDYLVMERVKGHNCLWEEYVNAPEKLSVVLGESVRRLHDLDHDDCPKKGINSFIVPLAHKKYQSNDIDVWLLEYSDYKTPEDAYRFLCEHEQGLVEDVCLHGDPSLPNILLENFKLSGFIDFDGGGIGDRHFDLLWVVWSLSFTLKTNGFKDRFLDAYGRDKFDVNRYNLCIALRAFTFTESRRLRGKLYESSI